jgi:hypothetical protein
MSRRMVLADKSSDENFDSRERGTRARDRVEMQAERSGEKNMVRAGEWWNLARCGMRAAQFE